MKVNEVFDEIRSVFGPDRVYGDPVERSGVTVIPVAYVSGGGGAGGEDAPGGSEDDVDGDGGSGGGFGVVARPAGALVIDADGEVYWNVPFNVNRVILGSQVVAAVCVFCWFWTERSKARSAAKAMVASALLEKRSA